MGRGVQLALDTSLEADSEEAEAARLKLQLSAEEWNAWETKKDEKLEERQRMREQVKQRFEALCERNNGIGGHAPLSGRAAKRAAAY